MNQEIKSEWVDALRSGEYKQTDSVLRRFDQDSGEESFCCLGVLCEIAVKHGVIGPVVQHSYDDGMVGWRYGESESLLPSAVVKWSEINTSDGRIPGLDSRLTGLNDCGETFDHIADVIENRF